MGKERERQSDTHVTPFACECAPLSLSLFSSFALHTLSYFHPAVRHPFPSQRSLHRKILSSERCVRFRVRVRTRVCVSPGQVNDPRARRVGSGSGGMKSGKRANEGRDGKTWSSRYCALLVNALLSLYARDATLKKKEKMHERARARLPQLVRHVRARNRARCWQIGRAHV